MDQTARRTRSGAGRAPGEVLLHPVALVALALLILNDHVLKPAVPGVLTGKLSDVAGLVIFPIVLTAGWELGAWLAGRRVPGDRAVIIAAIAVTGVGFALVKTIPAAADAFGRLLGVAQWLIALPAGVLTGNGVAPVPMARVIADPTDLLALPALGIALWVSRSSREARRSRAPEGLAPAVASRVEGTP